jgi:hypothetical protein
MRDRDDDDAPATVTRGQLRRLLKMEEDHARIVWLLTFLRRLMKWCTGAALFVTAAQAAYRGWFR